MNMRVGILGDTRGWELLLQQEGIPHDRVREALTAENYSVLVAGDEVDDRESEMLRQFLGLGGAVLCSSRVYARIRQSTYEHEYVQYILPDRESLFSGVGLIDVHQRCQLAWNANELRTDSGSYSGHIGAHEPGSIMALPFDPSSMVMDTSAATKSFYSPERRLPFERVSRISKGSVRRLVSRSLEILHHRRGLPYIHRWYFPGEARSVFAFRIDTDYASPSEIDELFQVVVKQGIPATWFVDVGSQQLFLSMFKRMDTQEIGIHCFEHKVFDGYAGNEKNIRQAMKVFEREGLSARGFAAPLGIWNDDLGRAILMAGFEYSSEFSYDHDNLPSYPMLHGEWSKTLQVPVHPICIGSLRRHGYFEEQMKSYFDLIVSQKLAMRDPMIFYHHPKDGHPAVLEHLFAAVKQARISPVPMHTYASWWKERSSMQTTMTMKGSILIPGGDPPKESVWLRITKADGTEAFSPMRKEINLDSLFWKRDPLTVGFPEDFTRIRKFNYRIPLTKTVDAVSEVMRLGRKKR